MIEPGRLMRAIWLQAQPIDRGYLVSGGRDRHMVEVDGGRCFCNCPDAQARDGDSCKHALLVRLLNGDPEVAKALRQLVPEPRWPKAKRLVAS